MMIKSWLFATVRKFNPLIIKVPFIKVPFIKVPFITVLLLIAQFSSAAAPIDPVSGFSYSDQGTHIEILGCPVGVCPSNDVVIPAQIIGKPVTHIGGFANQGITSVSIPNSVTYIGFDTFRGNLLTSVVIPDSVIFIENYAFQNNQISSLTLGSNVQYIRNYTFANNQLTQVKLPASLLILDNYAFESNLLQRVNFLGDRPSINQLPFNLNPSLSEVTYPAGKASWASNASIPGLSFSASALAAGPAVQVPTLPWYAYVLTLAALAVTGRQYLGNKKIR
ncbi:leucine-rich repeat domain-containing protein [uncultured Pseudoteredinibacter sp.]|uniref:leucine-rich repeat domain-containing protein n=1 Tax=uncultured Pseudoteredinibacter sp. TaxID=1641701 RepID=UPI00262378CC|nr:leucine-rich repeat domain-containing protein [uncultured Pseudoteredinibacter sp.]